MNSSSRHGSGNLTALNKVIKHDDPAVKHCTLFKDKDGGWGKENAQPSVRRGKKGTRCSDVAKKQHFVHANGFQSIIQNVIKAHSAHGSICTLLRAIRFNRNVRNHPSIQMCITGLTTADLLPVTA